MRQARVLKRVATAVAFSLAVASLGGCDVASFIDPSEFSPNLKGKTLQRPILTSLSSIDPSVDDPDVSFYNATDIKPIDNKVIKEDYKIGIGDLVVISVNDLVGLGVETTKQTRVSESGNVSMPLIGQVKAVGLTEDDLQKAIADAYRNGQIITNAQVTVTVAEARARTFSTIGSVPASGQYTIPQADFRLLDALVMIHDVNTNVDTVYIIRQVSEDPLPDGSAPPRPSTPSTPSTPSNPMTPTTPSAPPVDPLAPKGDVVGHAAMLQAGGPPAFAFNAPGGVPETRTIRVPLAGLRNGDLRYNIVIRPKDLIVAPVPPVGDYFLSGHSARPGVYTLPLKGITLKQAIIAAGMLDGVAIPQRTEIIRRVGLNREVFVSIDLSAIFNGLQPDLFLKPDDIVHVGTNLLAPFITAARGGFRISYGFGFLYDRNLYTGGNGF